MLICTIMRGIMMVSYRLVNDYFISSFVGIKFFFPNAFIFMCVCVNRRSEDVEERSKKPFVSYV